MYEMKCTPRWDRKARPWALHNISIIKTKSFYFDVVQLHNLPVNAIKPGLLLECLVLKRLLFHFFPPIRMLNHIILFCWKVSIVTHAQCQAGYGLHLERPWTQGSAPLDTSSALVGSEWVCAGHPTKTRSVCFLSWRTCCDISPGDNMLIYSAAVEAKCNAPLQPSTHASLMANINPHVISRSPRAPTYKGGCAHCRPALDRITSDAIYYHTDFYLLSHSPLSAFLHHSGPAQPRSCTVTRLLCTS